MPQSGDYSVCGAVSAAPLSAASQLKADEGKQLTIPDYDIPSQSGKNDDISRNLNSTFDVKIIGKTYIKRKKNVSS